MSINVSSNFHLFATLPLDSRMQVATIVARNAIPAGERYEGLETYCLEDETAYRLVGGIDNANWVASNQALVPYGTKSSSVDGGTRGEMCVDDDYLYICVVTGAPTYAVWKKIALMQT